MRYRALLAYDGTAYHGFQWQPQVSTVQGEVERALAEVTQQKVRLLAAGRTDAGVHARGQVIAFDVVWRHKVDDLHRALNALLPADIVVRELEPAPSGFHPRYDAQRRIYRYTVLNQRWRDPLLRRVTYHLREPLDVAAMDRASQKLIGVHDFAAFGQPTQEDGATIRQVFAARCWSKNSLVHFEIEANAFLRRMARRLMGTLLWVGRGRCSVDDFGAILSAGASGKAGPSVPPQGLCLREVVYEWQWDEG
ncbi:MAG: tRNA pseudouridine(38-40) synthase TruA [Chloroflexota bacterium]|nr:tRNA pseudouridine(38-40) synthase TruA [Chloroflexota bacterium]